MKKNIPVYLLFIGTSLAVGFASSLLTGDMTAGYEAFVKPPLSPPPVVFPIVWTVLYILMGVGAAMAYLSDGQSKGASVTFFIAQLFVNFFWPIIFFGLEMYLAAFFWLILLFVLVILMTRSFAMDSLTAAYLQIPYILWLIFAMYLNIMVWLLN